MTQDAKLAALFECLHHANPTDSSQWHVKPGSHNAFSKAIAALRDGEATGGWGADWRVETSWPAVRAGYVVCAFYNEPKTDADWCPPLHKAAAYIVTNEEFSDDDNVKIAEFIVQTARAALTRNAVAIATDRQIEDKLTGNAGMLGARAMASESLKSVASVKIGRSATPPVAQTGTVGISDAMVERAYNAYVSSLETVLIGGRIDKPDSHCRTAMRAALEATLSAPTVEESRP